MDHIRKDKDSDYIERDSNSDVTRTIYDYGFSLPSKITESNIPPFYSQLEIVINPSFIVEQE